MKQAPRQLQQPGQMEIQPLLRLLNGGHFAQAEVGARQLLQRYPQAFILYNVLGVAQEWQGNYAEAAETYRQALRINAEVAEIHFNLGVALANLGQTEQAMDCYRRAISLNPRLAAAHFNLGCALQQQQRYAEAAESYQKAVTIEPGLYEAYGNLGTIFQKQGRLEEAVASYRKGLAIRADALGYFNLGTALRDQGRHAEAEGCYLKALALNPNYADAQNNLGEILRDQGRMDDAIKCYQTALAIHPEHPNASYNMGEFLYLAGRYHEAVEYFQRSRFADWQERVLACLYRTGQYAAFHNGLHAFAATGKPSTLLAALSVHYATNFGVENPYFHCPQPMALIYHSRIDELANPNSPLLAELLRDISHTAITERKQGRLYYGIQSAGNLLKRPEPSFQKLAKLIRLKIREYRAHYAAHDCGLIRDFPREIEFSSSWYLKMTKGGHLTSHIHEEGWISGCVYLKLPTSKQDETEGALAISTDGDNYPRQHDEFPNRIIVQQVGDIVLFPSSLFHRTIAFHSDEERVCVAFDVKPMLSP